MEERKNKSLTNKQLLGIEVLIICSATIILIGAVFIYEYLEIDIYPKKLLILFSVIYFAFSLYVSLRLEWMTGCYKCHNCEHEFIPSFWRVVWAPHSFFKRYLKCPRCNKKSWHKKVLK